MLGYQCTVERREGSHLSVCATAKETRERERASEREREQMRKRERVTWSIGRFTRILVISQIPISSKNQYEPKRQP
jgi:uncharacterized membrane protein YvbJ